jgi:hypothetical protein
MGKLFFLCPFIYFVSPYHYKAWQVYTKNSGMMSASTQETQLLEKSNCIPVQSATSPILLQIHSTISNFCILWKCPYLLNFWVSTWHVSSCWNLVKTTLSLLVAMEPGHLRKHKRHKRPEWDCDQKAVTNKLRSRWKRTTAYLLHQQPSSECPPL